MTRQVECADCGVTPHDLPYEEMGLSLDDAIETLFVFSGHGTHCQGCAPPDPEDPDPTGLLGW